MNLPKHTAIDIVELWIDYDRFAPDSHLDP